MGVGNWSSPFGMIAAQYGAMAAMGAYANGTISAINTAMSKAISGNNDVGGVTRVESWTDYYTKTKTGTYYDYSKLNGVRYEADLSYFMSTATACNGCKEDDIGFWGRLKSQYDVANKWVGLAHGGLSYKIGVALSKMDYTKARMLNVGYEKEYILDIGNKFGKFKLLDKLGIGFKGFGIAMATYDVGNALNDLSNGFINSDYSKMLGATEDMVMTRVSFIGGYGWLAGSAYSFSKPYLKPTDYLMPLPLIQYKFFNNFLKKK
jgi:hypothetical protein